MTNFNLNKKDALVRSAQNCPFSRKTRHSAPKSSSYYPSLNRTFMERALDSGNVKIKRQISKSNKFLNYTDSQIELRKLPTSTLRKAASEKQLISSASDTAPNASIALSSKSKVQNQYSHVKAKIDVGNARKKLPDEPSCSPGTKAAAAKPRTTERDANTETEPSSKPSTKVKKRKKMSKTTTDPATSTADESLSDEEASISKQKIRRQHSILSSQPRPSRRPSATTEPNATPTANRYSPLQDLPADDVMETAPGPSRSPLKTPRNLNKKPPPYYFTSRPEDHS